MTDKEERKIITKKQFYGEGLERCLEWNDLEDAPKHTMANSIWSWQEVAEVCERENAKLEARIKELEGAFDKAWNAGIELQARINELEAEISENEWDNQKLAETCDSLQIRIRELEKLRCDDKRCPNRGGFAMSNERRAITEEQWAEGASKYCWNDFPLTSKRNDEEWEDMIQVIIKNLRIAYENKIKILETKIYELEHTIRCDKCGFKEIASMDIVQVCQNCGNILRDRIKE
jgi:chromosome segregation ATPase